mmetsp:Transcript_36635/g.42577  ORF Transcript_36635/g.42577 Transcript_36635/m.42577 type:complete len:95 (+) Transcript_36635:653-937(+)
MNKERKNITEPGSVLILVPINRQIKGRQEQCAIVVQRITLRFAQKYKYNKEKIATDNTKGTLNNPQKNKSDLVMYSFIKPMMTPINAVESAATL